MATEFRPSEIVRFGDTFALDRGALELRREGRQVRLDRIALDVLLFLVERDGQVLSCAQIASRIFGSPLPPDSGDRIQGAVRQIRTALRDDPANPRFIQSVPGRGYRFVAPLTAGFPEVRRPVAAARSASARLIPRAPRRGRPLPWLVALTGILVVAGALALSLHLSSQERAHAAVRPLELAVLPLTNLTGNPKDDSLADGLTRRLIAQLGSVEPERLTVTPRSAVMRYKDSALSDDQIARSLHAKYVLEGSVRRDGDLVRVSAQVVRIEDQTRVWTEQYDHQLTSAAEMQDELATVITKGVHTTLTGHETTTAQLHQSSYGSATHEAAPAQSSGSDASDLTQHAKLAVGQRSAQGLTQGIALYNQALARDPTDAAAWAGLAEAYTRTSTLGLAAPEQVMSQARAAAARALELDPNLAAAHLAAGSIAESFDYDWQQAAEEFRKAISLDPAAAAAHAAYALLLARQGQFAPAMAESARALAAEPLSPALATDHATVLYLAGDYQAAAQTVSRTLALAPGAAGLRLLIASEAAQGQLQAALAQARAYHEAVPTSEASASLAYLYGRAGQSSEAEQALRAMEDEAASEGSDPLPLRAMALAGMGDKERLLATLDEAYREHADFLSTLKVDPAYAALSGDARFEELMHRVGLD